jgi:hypothetical protein
MQGFGKEISIFRIIPYNSKLNYNVLARHFLLLSIVVIATTVAHVRV